MQKSPNKAQQAEGPKLGQSPPRRFQPVELDEQCQHSFYSPLKPALDELRQSTASAVARVEERPMSPMVALMLRQEY